MRCTILTAATISLIAATVNAQAPPAEFEFAYPPASQRQLAEDMDIFRDLLQETLTATYSTPPQKLLSSTWLIFSAGEAGELRAAPKSKVNVALPSATPLHGYGVVFRATVPPFVSPPKKTQPQEIISARQSCVFFAKSRWEKRAALKRFQVNSEKQACAKCHRPASKADFEKFYSGTSLHELDDLYAKVAPHAQGPTREKLVADVVKVLAESGKHFHLPSDQRLSVVLTFQARKSTSAPGSLGMGMEEMMMDAGEAGGEAMMGSSGRGDFGAMASGMIGGGTGGSAAGMGSMMGGMAMGGSSAVKRSQEEVEADLLVRNKDYEKAAKKYAAAIDKLLRSKPNDKTNLLRLFNRVVQAHLHNKDYQAAADALDLVKMLDSGKGNPAKDQPSSGEPLHLLEVSVLKKHLDAVKFTERKNDGTAPQVTAESLDELRKHVTITEFNPPAEVPALNKKVTGLVTKVRGLSKLVEINVGSDDGIRIRTTMVVMKGKTERGKVEVVFLSPDRAVCRILEGKAETGDEVHTH